jgi:uncharacterized protein
MSQSASDISKPSHIDISAELKAAAFDRLLQHLRAHPEVQNIALMNLADFCRNCLSQWLSEAAAAQGRTLDKEAAREYVYGMPFALWKQQHQRPATPEEQAQFEARAALKNHS